MKPDATGGAEHAHTDSKQAQAEGVHLGIGELGAVCGAAPWSGSRSQAALSAGSRRMVLASLQSS